MSGPCRPNLERAILAAGFGTRGEFARAVGVTGSAVSRWLTGRSAPGAESRRAISEALDLSPGADCDEVADADLDWLLEVRDAPSCADSGPGRCDG